MREIITRLMRSFFTIDKKMSKVETRVVQTMAVRGIYHRKYCLFLDIYVHECIIIEEHERSLRRIP